MEKKKLTGWPLVLVLMCFASYVLFSLYFNSFGANAETAMGFFDVGESKLGFIVTMQAIGGIAVTVLLGLFGERINKIRGILFGMIVMGIAALCIGTMPLYKRAGSGYGLLLAISLIGGVGYYFIDLLANGVVADVFPTRQATLLPFVHGFYSLGAMLAPLFVTAVTDNARAESFAKPYLIVGIATLLCCVLLAVTCRRVTPSSPYANMAEIRKRSAANPAEVFCSARAWLFMLATFFFLSFQMGMSTWFPSFCMNWYGAPRQSAAFSTMLYFLGMLIMRFIAPTLYRWITVRRFYVLTTAVSTAVFAACFLLPLPQVARSVLLLFGGLLQGASLPALVILCCEAFPTRTASASSIVLLATAFVSFVTPAAMGAMVERMGYLAPMLVITCCLPISAFIVALTGRRAGA